MRMMRRAALVWCYAIPLYGQGIPYELPLRMGVFEQPIHQPFTTDQGLPNNDVKRIYRYSRGRLVAITAGGVAVFTGVDGLPYNDFTCIATGAGDVWFGTSNGAICYRNGEWSLLNNSSVAHHITDNPRYRKAFSDSKHALVPWRRQGGKRGRCDKK